MQTEGAGDDYLDWNVTTPNTVYSVDLKKGTPRLLLDPGVEHWADVAFGTVTYWKSIRRHARSWASPRANNRTQPGADASAILRAAASPPSNTMIYRW